MPRGLKHNIEVDTLHKLNAEGYSIPELSEMFSIPKTTINRYLKSANYVVYNNRHRHRISTLERRKKYSDSYDYKHSANWKQALILLFGYRCQICGYDVVVDAHHIIPRFMGGKSYVSNGILLCPNHHAEVHAGLVDIKGLLKLGELLGPLEEGNQQPSRISDLKVRKTKGSTTNSRAKAVMETRAPSTCILKVKI